MKVSKVKYLSDYKLEIKFDDGKVNVVDFEKFLNKSQNPMISKYKNINKFKKVEIDTGFLSWNDGEMEISSQTLYNNMII